MPITDKPASWRFEIETPELGNEDAVTTALWEQVVLSAQENIKTVNSAGEEEILYDRQLFRFKAPLRVEAEARWAEDDLCVSISVHTSFTSSCSRCLEPADIEILDDFMYLYSLRKKTAVDRDVAEGTEEGYQVVPVAYWKNRLDIAEQVWESLILSLPMRVLCSKECRGICPTCGKSLNSDECICSFEAKDPRFEKLLAMEFNQDQE